MNIKFSKLVMIATFINIGLGLFLVICGILEFTGAIQTRANNTIESAGVQLSYLVLISGILTLGSGTATFLNRKTFDRINLLIFLGIVALAWPIFVSIALLFSQYIICIRLLPTMLSSLFYIISILIVKIANEEMRQGHKFDPTALANATTLKTPAVDIKKVISNSNQKKKSGANIKALGNIAGSLTSGRVKRFSLGRIFYSGSRRKSGGGLGRRLYSGGRSRGRFRIRRR